MKYLLEQLLSALLVTEASKRIAKLVNQVLAKLWSKFSSGKLITARDCIGNDPSRFTFDLVVGVLHELQDSGYQIILLQDVADLFLVLTSSDVR